MVYIQLGCILSTEVLHRGIGLESAMAFTEAGARVVYCVDLPLKPGEEWTKVRDYLGRVGGLGRLEYVSGDVRDQVRPRLLVPLRARSAVETALSCLIFI